MEGGNDERTEGRRDRMRCRGLKECRMYRGGRRGRKRDRKRETRTRRQGGDVCVCVWG